MGRRGAYAAELAAWWAVLVALWLTLVSRVDRVEWAVGVPAALLGALAACGARRAVARR
ncbi:hypothetical protein [Streptomyces tremellae]|uniref:Uncharacterized protein n=1 Tax=Streptomyces tremellae TaxID=1124239 RepID=A0ABP7E3J5_9ACTN